MNLPDFLIIGSAKSGTTTLYEYLNRHPQIYMSSPKEPSFFIERKRYKEWKSWNNWLAQKGENFITKENEEQRELEWYASLFEDARPDQVCGEASTPYTHWPVYTAAAKNIAKALPDVKLIYIMRHPVDRAYSHYVQLIKNAQVRGEKMEVSQTFEESIEQDPLYLATSDYLSQINQYLEYFPIESFLFLFMEDLIKTPATVIKEAAVFLGVDPSVDIVQSETVVANTAKQHNDWFVRSRMTAPLKAIPGMKTLIDALPQGLKDTAYSTLKKVSNSKKVEDRYIPKPMLPETRQFLIDKFRESNAKLGELVGRDLSHWDH